MLLVFQGSKIEKDWEDSSAAYLRNFQSRAAVDHLRQQEQEGVQALIRFNKLCTWYYINGSYMKNTYIYIYADGFV